MEAQHDLELLEQAITAAEPESEGVLATIEPLNSSVKDVQQKKNKNSSPDVAKKKKSASAKKKTPEVNNDGSNPKKKKIASAKKKTPEVNNDDSNPNAWNSSRLRPRPDPEEKKKQQMGRYASASATKVGPKDDTPKKFSVSLKLTLTKKEIVDDFMAMTGKMPPSKPTKRNKQEKQMIPNFELGTIFTESITVDTYKTEEPVFEWDD